MFMNRLLKRVIRDMVKFIAALNSELPKILEQDMANIQGKGFGAQSVGAEVQCALELFQKKFAGNNIDKFLVFDVGANIGNYTREVLKADLSCIIFSFEPSFKSYQTMMQNVKSANVSILNFGFSDNVSEKILFSDEPGSAISSLTKRNLEHFGIEFSHEERVKMDTLDNFCNTNSVIPDLLKIDVEGHELDVLLGGLEIIDKVSIIQFEFGGCNIDTRTYFQDFWYFFKQHDFSLYRITKTGPQLISTYSEADEYFSTTNYLATNNRFGLKS